MFVIRLYSGQRNRRAMLPKKWVAFLGAGLAGRGGSRREATDPVSIKKIVVVSSGDCSPIVEQSATARTPRRI
jgi:hypothetical protein